MQNTLRKISRTNRTQAATSWRLPIFDVDELLAACDHDCGVVADQVELFFTVYREELPHLRGAVARQDAEAIARRAHRLKGSAENLSGKALQAAAETLEQQALAGNLAILPDLLDRLEHEYLLLKPALQSVVRLTLVQKDFRTDVAKMHVPQNGEQDKPKESRIEPLPTVWRKILVCLTKREKNGPEAG